MNETSTIAIRVDPDFHRRLKVHLATRGISLKDYITSLIEKDLEQESAEHARQQDDRADLRNCALLLQDNLQRLLDILER